MAELLPCPFCGGKADIRKHSFWNDKAARFEDKTYSVKCCVCHTQIYPFFETEKLAIDAWNTRTPQKEG